MSSIIGRVDEPDAQREAELVAAIAGKTGEADFLIKDWGPDTASPTVKRRIIALEQEIATLEAELEAHRRQARIADANRGRNQITEFLTLVRRMDAEIMDDEERFLLRVKLSSEFKRLITVLTTDGKDLVASLRTPPGSEPVDIRLQWGFMERPGQPTEILYLPMRDGVMFGVVALP